MEYTHYKQHIMLIIILDKFIRLFLFFLIKG